MNTLYVKNKLVDMLTFISLLSGTKCCPQKYPLQQIAFGHELADEAKMKELEEKYTPEIVRHMDEMGKKLEAMAVWIL